MMVVIVLDILAIVLLVIHFGVPLMYYLYLRRQLARPWGVSRVSTYMPKITVIVPTYNESELIEQKLDNIYSQEYPRELLEIIVVDSASTDNTLEIARKWAKEHSDINVKFIKEPVRRGKAIALNTALRDVTGEIIVITDVDALWQSRDALKRVVEWFSDARIGAVSCLKKPKSERPVKVEESYRQYYNILRLAESKIWSTPVFHGELAAFRKNLLERLGGFPTDIGSDDSHTATRIALMGYRAIIPDDITCIEAIPFKDYHLWRIRRAQHLIQHFIKVITMKTNVPKQFKNILYIEFFLHVLNPWLLLGAVMLLAISAILGSLLALSLLVIGVLLLFYNPYRTWIVTQVYLILAMIRNMWTKDIVWRKQFKNRVIVER